MSLNQICFELLGGSKMNSEPRLVWGENNGKNQSQAASIFLLKCFITIEGCLCVLD